MTQSEIRRKLKLACREAGSQRAFARKHRINHVYLNSVVRGHSSAGPKILSALGLARTVEAIGERK